MVPREPCVRTVLDMARSYVKRTRTCMYGLEFRNRPDVLLYLSCKKCKGKKTVKEKTRQEIFIERGMADRQRIVLSGAGDEEVCLPSTADVLDHRSLTKFNSPACLLGTSFSN